MYSLATCGKCLVLWGSVALETLVVLVFFYSKVYRIGGVLKNLPMKPFGLGGFFFLEGFKIQFNVLYSYRFVQGYLFYLG